MPPPPHPQTTTTMLPGYLFGPGLLTILGAIRPFGSGEDCGTLSERCFKGMKSNTKEINSEISDQTTKKQMRDVVPHVLLS